jgi:bilirubin oxidase
MKVFRVLLIGVAGIILLVVGFVVVVLLLRPHKSAFPNEHLALDNKLAIPPLLQPRILKNDEGKDEKVFDLTAQAGEMVFVEGKSTSTWGFNGDYLGPTLRAGAGDRVRMNVTNSLSETVTVHWHGMRLPAAMDGGPHQLIAPGETWQPYWTITNEASTLWYHPHQMGATGTQVWRGLAGMFIIDDANSASLDLPAEYGVDDIPLVVQDRKFDSDGQFVYKEHGSNSELPAPAGMLGDTILVNGTLAPYLDVPQKLVRLRVLNGSNGRRYNFGFSDDRSFYQIATDGGLLDAPVERTRMLLGAGERAEILVDLSDVSSPIDLVSYPVAGDGNAILGIIRGFFGEDDLDQQFKILELRPQAGSFDAQEIPAKLNNIERLDEGAATTTRRFNMDARTINNNSMDHMRVDEVVKRGDVEIWEVQNQSPFYHPFHVHGAQFLVLERDRAAAAAHEQGWKDTVIVNPAETVRVIMRFEDYADPNLPYMFHCHILEHEDMGMMGQFVVVDSLSDEVQIESPLTESPEDDHSHR